MLAGFYVSFTQEGHLGKGKLKTENMAPADWSVGHFLD